MIISFDVPVYFVQEFKRKENKTWLVGMNWYRNAHFAVQALVKKHYHDLLKELLSHVEVDSPLMSYQVSYTYYYKNIQTDLPNVAALISKFCNDTFQELGFVIDDNVQHLQEEHFYVGGRDSSNPRIHVVLKDL